MATEKPCPRPVVRTWWIREFLDDKFGQLPSGTHPARLHRARFSNARSTPA